MKTNTVLILVLILTLISIPSFAGDDEVTLFNGAGKAVAYIALDDEMTIYLWSGKPVAYLSEDNSGGYHIYGFNGNHLGWFLKGAVWDHQGNATCAVKEVMQSTEFEPFKAFKEFKPFKSFKEFGPFRPSLSNSFGDIPCRFLLASGAAD